MGDKVSLKAALQILNERCFRTAAGIRTPILVSIPVTVTRLLTQYGFLILVFEGSGFEADGLGIEVQFPTKAIYCYFLWRRHQFW